VSAYRERGQAAQETPVEELLDQEYVATARELLQTARSLAAAAREAKPADAVALSTSAIALYTAVGERWPLSDGDIDEDEDIEE
jgi:hypothetical protein